MHRDHKFGSLISDNNDLYIKYEKQGSKNSVKRSEYTMRTNSIRMTKLLME